jgi:hypothetical protein
MMPIGDAGRNHLFVITLRIYLQKINSPPTTKTDSNGQAWPIKAWTDTQWAAFQLMVKQQAQDWDKRFTLVPKNYMAHYVANPGGKKSPCLWSANGKLYSEPTFAVNVECKFMLQLLNSPSGADRVIDVANLDTAHPAFTSFLLAGGKADSKTFRSNALLYDSLDGIATQFSIPDNIGHMQSITHKSVQHEIGHALGLPHIGVTMKTAKCLDAKAKAESHTPVSDPHASGGKNSEYCYGYGESADIAKNVMGFGIQFAAVNAEPWLTAVCDQTGTKAEHWEVVVDKKVPPKQIKS